MPDDVPRWGPVPQFWTYSCKLEDGEEWASPPFEASSYDFALERGRLIMHGHRIERLVQPERGGRWEVPVVWQSVERAGYWPPGGLPRVELEIYAPMAEKPGFLEFVRRKTFREAADELRPILEAYGFEMSESPHHLAPGLAYGRETDGKAPADEELPPYRWIASYTVRGGSEGHWGHVDLIDEEGRAHSFLLSKTLEEGVRGWRRASECAAAVGFILGA
jgi:hypothetical protein